MEKRPKFSVGDKVKVVRLLDVFTDRRLIGVIGIVQEIDQIEVEGKVIQVNYYVDGYYVHEEELEKVNNNGEGVEI